MAFACQKNSYLQKLNTVVKSCTPSKFKTIVGGKKTVFEGYDVVLEDSVLFPEGGGQPDDRGTINKEPVLRVVRNGTDAVHFVAKEFDAGQNVCVEVDWSRRWDHMQQHSGQHLITAIADNKYGYATTSWNLGEKTSFLELDTGSLTVEEMEELEHIVNDKIKACIPMYPTLYSGIDDPQLKQVRTRPLPTDHEGPIRVVTIEGIDTNTCCGTHVSNLAHLQAIKLLSVEKGKKGKVNLVFIAGQRVLDYAGSCFQKEKTFTMFLKGGPDQHVELLEKVTKNLKEVKKNETMLLRDVAKLEVELFKKKHPIPDILDVHRKEGDMEFLNLIANEVSEDNICVVATCGDLKGSGMFIITAPPAVLSQASSKILELLEGKGACKNNRLQGKANKLSQRDLVVNTLKNLIKEL